METDMHIPFPHFHFGLPPHIFHGLFSLAVVCGIVYLIYRFVKK